MGLATRAEIKAALAITTTDNDAQIDALIEPMSALIEREAGREFVTAGGSPTTPFTERHPGGEPTIALRQYPVESITTVTDKATGVVLAADQYELEAATGLLRRLTLGSQWAEARADQVVHLRENTPVHRWEIVYIANPVVPEDIKLALYYSISAAITGAGMAGMQSEKDGDYSYVRMAMQTAPGSLPANAMAIARSYRQGFFV